MASAWTSVKPRDAQNNPRFASHVDFEWGYQQINGNHPGAGPGSYSVAQGDTLQGIARAAYGDARQWYRIAEANGLSSDRDLKVGQSLVIPSQVSGTHNASDTFEPYDPARIVGDTSPTLPVPQGQGGGCGGLGMVIMVVVAVVVTASTRRGAAAGAMGATLSSSQRSGCSLIDDRLESRDSVCCLAPEASVLQRSALQPSAGPSLAPSPARWSARRIGAVDHFSWKQVALECRWALRSSSAGCRCRGEL